MWTKNKLSTEIENLFNSMCENCWIKTSSSNPNKDSLFEKESYTDYYGNTKIRYVLTSDSTPESEKDYYKYDEDFNGNEYFSKNFPKVLTNFMASGTVNTIDTGTTTSGELNPDTFGKGTVDLSGGEPKLEEKLNDASDKMNESPNLYDNAYYFTQMSLGLDEMFTTDNSVTTTVNGSATVGESVVKITGAKAQGKLVISFSPSFAEVLTEFSKLMEKQPWLYGDSELAEKISDVIYPLVNNTPIVTTSGTLSIEGSTGTGTIS